MIEAGISVTYIAQDAMTEDTMDRIERGQTRLVSFDLLTKLYCIVWGIKTDQEKREQHAKEAPLCADAALYWERVGNKKNAAECRLLASIRAAQS